LKTDVYKELKLGGSAKFRLHGQKKIWLCCHLYSSMPCCFGK